MAYEKLNIQIEGMHCISCANIIESTLKKLEGIKDCNVNFLLKSAYIEFDKDKINLKKIEKKIKEIGYKVKKNEKFDDLKRRFLISLIFSIPLFYFSMGIHLGLPSIAFFNKNNLIFQFIFTFIILISGFNIFKNGIISFFKTKKSTMDTLISLGVGSAFLYSFFIFLFSIFGIETFKNEYVYFEVSGFLITIILFGRYLEEKAKGKTSEAIKKLLELKPKYSNVLRDGKEIKIPSEEIKLNDVVIIKPGEKIPVDGVVLDGYSSVDESALTGESNLVEKFKGKEVYSGTINKNGTFKFIAQKTGKDTFLSQIIKLLEEAQTSKAPIQRIADVISSYFVPSVLIISIVSFFIWFLVGQGLGFSLKVAISVLIISCPCALGLATPTAIVVGMGIGAKNGIFFKNAEALQKLGKVENFLFDKTGTLTEGKIYINEITPLKNFKEIEILKFASILAKNSSHPQSEAILKKAEEKKIEIPDVKNFEEIPGKGLIGFYEGKKIILGNLRFLKELNFQINNYEEDDKNFVFVCYENEAIGIISTSDLLKSNAKDLINDLKNIKKNIYLISGDNKKATIEIAKELGIENFYFEVLPPDKRKIVEDLKKSAKGVAFIGDGINDAPALSSADIGIAFGGGREIAIEAGDIVLIKNDLKDILKGIKISNLTLKKIKQNLFWAFFYNVLAIPISAGVLYPFFRFLLSPIIAGIAMSLSSISVVVNSLSLKKTKIK